LPRLRDDASLDEDYRTTARHQLIDAETEVAIDLSGQVLPLVRSEQNPYSSKLAVGRTKNCDLRIDHNSISRLHALLLLGDGGTVRIVDAGSSNGTRVNGNAVGKEGMPLSFGDVVTFGSVPTQFVSEDLLYQALRNLRPLEHK